MLAQIKNLPRQKPKKQNKGILCLLLVSIFVMAWIVGGRLNGSAIEAHLPKAFPAADTFKSLSADIYAGFSTEGQIIGYVAIGEATGYGGPMQLAVAVDFKGKITGFALVDHKETPAYLDKVFKDTIISEMLGKVYDQPFELDNDLDGVTSATVTSAAIAESIKQASRRVAKEKLNLIVPPEPQTKVIFGLPEVILIALFVVGFMGRKRVIKKTKYIRWVTMITGLVMLGFIYSRPLNLSKVNMFLMGYLPAWQTNLYWYLLMGGILFIFIVENSNSYCEWFCPFGAAQECLGVIGGAKPRFSRKQQQIITWLQRRVTLLAIVVALLMRNPGVTSYEIFGAFFQLNGSTISFAVLGGVMVASLFSHRFWCRALCPIRSVEWMIRLIRGSILGLWQPKLKTKKDS